MNAIQEDFDRMEACEQKTITDAKTEIEKQTKLLEEEVKKVDMDDG